MRFFLAKWRYFARKMKKNAKNALKKRVWCTFSQICAQNVHHEHRASIVRY